MFHGDIMHNVYSKENQTKYYIEGDIQLQINTVKCHSPHTHDFIEFVYMMRGKSLHKINGVEYPLNSGDLLIINYDQVHSFNGDPNAIYCNFLIKPTLIDKRMEKCRDLFSLFNTANYKEFKELINNDCRHIHFSPEEKDCFEYMLRLLNVETKEKKIGYDLMTSVGVNFLLTMIFRKMCNTHKNQDRQITKIFEHINKNYDQNISVTMLARMCNYNSSYFSRIFKNYAGVPFSTYLKKVRIENACRIIKSQNITIGKLYTKVGYTNKTNFYKHFKEVTGVTPYQFKKVKN